MIAEAERNAEADKERKNVIEASNQADSVCAETEKAMNEFKEQIDAAEKEKVEGLIKELREIAMKGQAGDASVNSEQIRTKINETQQASLGFFQKVYEARAKANQGGAAASESTESSSTSSESTSSNPSEEKKN